MRVRGELAPAPRAETRAKLSRFAALAKEFEAAGVGQADATLRDVRAVPTIFPQVDQVLGVGGWPTDRFGLLHGESNGGKTEFALGLIDSFLRLDHAGLLVDAERTTPRKWVRQLLGERVQHPGFHVLYPDSYEATTDAVRAWCEALGNAREHRKIDEETTGIVIVDSLRKLVPRRILEKVAKMAADDEGSARQGARGVDGMGGRAAQYKAALNAAWMDELTPLLFQTRTALVAIARETEGEAGASSFNNPDDWKVGGGKAPYFESSVVARVTQGLHVYNDAKQIVSERHVVQVRKTKIAGKTVRYPAAHFCVATGADGRPYGFDIARDLVELAVQLGSVEQSGSHYSCGGERLGQGLDAVVLRLSREPELLARVELETRKLFMPEHVPEPVAPKPINRGKKPVAAKKASKKGRRR